MAGVTSTRAAGEVIMVAWRRRCVVGQSLGAAVDHRLGEEEEVSEKV